MKKLFLVLGCLYLLGCGDNSNNENVAEESCLFEEGNELAGAYTISSMLLVDPYGLMFRVPWAFGECFYDRENDEVEFGTLEDGNREFRMQFRVFELCFGDYHTGQNNTFVDVSYTGTYDFDNESIFVNLENDRELNFTYRVDGLIHLSPSYFTEQGFSIAEIILWPLDDPRYCE